MRYFALYFAAVTLASAAPREFTSSATRTHLIELFTSEGCSSCPPAEAWFGHLREQPGLWRDFVPVAWHVDYWDRLGWKDRFASTEATRRQHAYASAWRSSRVYTPCLVLDGREWRERTVPKTSRENAGILRTRYEAGRLAVSFDPSTSGGFEVHAVVLALGIVSKVTKGENRGRNLRHEFVAVTPSRSTELRENRAAMALPVPEIAGSSEFALAVWITRRQETAIVQATGGILGPLR